jgi:peptide/nickel transport system permease protein
LILRSRFLRLVFRKAIGAGLLILGITLILFVLSAVSGADPTAAALGDEAMSDPAVVAAFREAHGLDKPWPERYIAYVSDLMRGDMGVSVRTNTPVGTELSRAVPATIELAVVAILITVVVGVTLGTVAAINRGRAADQVIRLVSLSGLSMPTFYLALVAYYLLFVQLGIAPSGGRLGPLERAPPAVTGAYTLDALIAGNVPIFLSALHHILLPALVLSAHGVSTITRFVRTAVLEVLEAEYVLAARAKGLPERIVIVRYVLRAAFVSILTLLGVVFAGLLSGAIVTETIFSWPGLGRFALRSATTLDLNGILGVTLVIGFIYVVVNFAVDLLYALIDPRMRAQ